MHTHLLQLETVICAVSSLPALIVSVQRLLREKGILSTLLAVCCVVLTATYISAVFHAEAFLSLLSLWNGTEGLITNILAASIALTLCCIGGNMLVWFFVLKVTSDNLWRWFLIILGCFLLLLLLLGLSVSILTGLSFGTAFFCSCCGFMGAGGVAWGLSYKEICVIGNIYLESGICLLSALWLTWVCVKRYIKAKTTANRLLMVLGCLYGAAYVVAFVGICIHYAMPMDAAFDLCYNELMGLTQKWHLSYYNVNYLLFILPFIILTTVNLFMAWFIQKKR